MRSHPIHRFEAPSSIQTGTPLADLFSDTAIALIGESFAEGSSCFDLERFLCEAIPGAHGKALKAKAAWIGGALRRALPADDLRALSALGASWGPPLQGTHDNGLQGLFYMPHSEMIALFAGTDDDQVFQAGLEANFQLTTRFSAEFSIRPYLTRRWRPTVAALESKLHDRNPHLRRLVSEGTRPRLPWASHLKQVRANPDLTLPLLDALKDDSDRYVTRSVANHLGDIGKDHPGVLFATCEAWLDDLDGPGVDPRVSNERKWLIRHALRHPDKKGVLRARDLRIRAGARLAAQG